MATPDGVLGFDWSFANVDPKAFVAAGYKVALRYLGRITPQEYVADKAAGLTVILTFEEGAADAMGGAATGTAHAQRARAKRQAIGAPLNEQTIYAFDTDDRGCPGWADKLHAYMCAAEAVSGHAEGIYGSIRVVEEMKHRNPARAGWQAAAWSNGVISPLADFYQPIGHHHLVPGVDNNAYDEDVIIHMPGLVPVPPAPLKDDDVQVYKDSVHAGLDGAHAKLATVSTDGSVILANGAAVGDNDGTGGALPTVNFGGLTVIAAPYPAGWKHIGSYGDGNGFVQWAVSPDGQWHPYRRSFV
jgi:hypothetical protein